MEPHTTHPFKKPLPKGFRSAHCTSHGRVHGARTPASHARGEYREIREIHMDKPRFFATVENVHHGIYRVDVFKGQVLKGSQFYANEHLARRFASTVNKRR